MFSKCNTPKSALCGLFMASFAALLIPEGYASAEVRFFPALEYYSVGKDALDYQKKQALFTDIQTTLVDGQKKSSDINISYDRSLVADFRVGYNRPINAKIGVRTTIGAVGTLRKEHTDFEPISVTEVDGYEARPTLDFTFLTASGVEFSAGIQYFYMPEYFGEKETHIVNSNFRYAEYSLRQPRITIVKRGGFGQGGFFFKSGVEAVRDVEISIEDNTEAPRITRQAIRKPTTIGIMMEFKVGSSDWYAEFQGVQAGEGGERKADSNKTIREDYNVIKIGWGKGFSVMNLNLLLTHKTLSYASSEDTRLDLVPMTAFHARAKAGGKESYVYAGLVYLYAKDLQSEDEFNQEFRISGYGASAGFRLSL